MISMWETISTISQLQIQTAYVGYIYASATHRKIIIVVVPVMRSVVLQFDVQTTTYHALNKKLFACAFIIMFTS